MSYGGVSKIRKKIVKIYFDRTCVNRNLIKMWPWNKSRSYKCIILQVSDKWDNLLQTKNALGMCSSKIKLLITFPLFWNKYGCFISFFITFYKLLHQPGINPRGILRYSFVAIVPWITTYRNVSSHSNVSWIYSVLKYETWLWPFVKSKMPKGFRVNNIITRVYNTVIFQ